MANSDSDGDDDDQEVDENAQWQGLSLPDGAEDFVVDPNFDGSSGPDIPQLTDYNVIRPSDADVREVRVTFNAARQTILEQLVRECKTQNTHIFKWYIPSSL